MKILKNKKNFRIIDISNFKLKNLTSIKPLDGSFLIQTKDSIIIDQKKLKCVTKLKPSKKRLAEIKFAFNISKYVKSNAIVLCNNFSTIGIERGSLVDWTVVKLQCKKQSNFNSQK